jgi:hypothetical protein
VVVALAGTLGLAAGREGAAQNQKGPRKHRVTFDLSAEGQERWDGALRNVENVRKAFGPENVEAQIVVHGKALSLLQKTNREMEGRLRGVAESGVRLSACQNTMKRFNVTQDMLFPFADTVDSAVAELVRKQEAGWAYIKVGG